MRHEYTTAAAGDSGPNVASRGGTRHKTPPVGGSGRASISYHEGSARAMAQVPVKDRPREKLARVGAEALADIELLALVIGAGTRRRGALGVAQDLLEAAGGVHGLAQVGLDGLYHVAGVGQSRAARVLAAVELGRRTLATGIERPMMRSIHEVARYLAPRYSVFPVERVGVMMLDGKQRLIRTAILSMGSVESSLAHPRDVFRVAAMASAAGVVVFHNHPTGDPAPSAEDRFVTDRLRQAGEVMGIELIDHIILGHGKYFSFREEARR